MNHLRPELGYGTSFIAFIALLGPVACSDAADEAGQDAVADVSTAPDADEATNADSDLTTDADAATGAELPIDTGADPDTSIQDVVEEVAALDAPTDAPGDEGEVGAETAEVDTSDAEVQADTRIHLTVYDPGGAPLGGVPVVFHDANGRPVSEGVSDDDGQVEVEGEGVAMATAIFGDAASPRLTTILGLAPGQQVTIGTPPQTPVDPGARVTLETHLPERYLGAANYDIASGCGSHGGSYIEILQTQQSEICWTGDHRLDVLATALDDGGTALAFAVAPDVPVPADASVVQVALDAWRTDWQHVSTTLEAIPDGIDELGYALSARLGGQVFALPWGKGKVAAGTGDKVTTDLPLPPGFFTGLGASITISAHGDAVVSEQQLTWHDDGVPDTLNANVDQIRLPFFSAVTGASTESGLRIDWTADRSLAGVTAVVADLFWDTGSGWGDWTIQAPGGEAPFILAPQLPATHAGLLPTASVGAPLAALQVIDLGATTTYAKYQTTCGTSFGCSRLRAPAGTWERRASAGSPDL